MHAPARPARGGRSEQRRGTRAALSINQVTVEAAGRCPNSPPAAPRPGVAGVGLWRDAGPGVRRRGARAKLVRDAGLAVTILCRGGFFTAIDPAERAAPWTTTARAIDEAATLGTDTLVLVSGGLPAGSQDLRGARERIADALAELGPYARDAGVRLAIEPLHPMYASDRCVVSTLAQALDLAERFPAEQVGVVGGHVPHLVGRHGARADRPRRRRRPDRRLPARRLDHPVAGGRAQRPRPARRRLRSTCAEWTAHVEAAGYTGPDRGRDVQRRAVGPGRRARCSRRPRRGSWSTWREGGARGVTYGRPYPVEETGYGRPGRRRCDGVSHARISMPWERSSVRISIRARCSVRSRSTLPVTLLRTSSSQLVILVLRQCLMPPGGL